jgi:hypothetical protein
MFESRPGNGGFAKAMRINGGVLSITTLRKKKNILKYTCSKQTCENLLDLLTGILINQDKLSGESIPPH